MSLVKRPRMTEKKRAQIQRMQRLSNGPATREGRGRVRDAHLRHGFYAQFEKAALRALGEDPAEFLGVVEGLRAKFLPADAAEDHLVTSLARSLWWIDRVDRQREGETSRQARQAHNGRERRLHAQMMRLKMNEDYVGHLLHAAAQPHFVATPDHLKQIQSLHEEGVMKEMGEIIVALFVQLREPGTPAPGEPGAGVDRLEQQRQVLLRIKEIFGLAPDDNEKTTKPGLPPASPSLPEPGAAEEPGAELAPSPAAVNSRPAPPPQAAPNPYPQITEEEWEEREPARQLLENLLRREVEAYQQERQAILREWVAGPTPFELGAEIAPTEPDTKRFQRIAETHVRQASTRLDLLIKLKRQSMS